MSDGSERRRMRRHRLHEHDITTARIKPGRQASLIDVCAGGALIETAHRLLPGSPIELHLATAERHVAMRGHVLRCTVVRLRASAVSYRGAIGFDGHLPGVREDDEIGYSVPGAERRAQRCTWADTSHWVIG